MTVRPADPAYYQVDSETRVDPDEPLYADTVESEAQARDRQQAAAQVRRALTIGGIVAVLLLIASMMWQIF